jgi:hypothetical protein
MLYVTIYNIVVDVGNDKEEIMHDKEEPFVEFIKATLCIPVSDLPQNSSHSELYHLVIFKT